MNDSNGGLTASQVIEYRDRFIAAQARRQARAPRYEVIGTQEEAEAEGVRLGDTVLRHASTVFVPGAQESLDDWFYAVWLRAGGSMLG